MVKYELRPDYSVIPDDDLAAIKDRARCAWRDCRAKASTLVPAAVADKLWTNGLLAAVPRPANTARRCAPAGW